MLALELVLVAAVAVAVGFALVVAAGCSLAADCFVQAAEQVLVVVPERVPALVSAVAVLA